MSAEPVEPTLWKIVRGSPSPEELAAVAVVLTACARRAAAPGPALATVVPVARWRHQAEPVTSGSWRAA
ncbi:acyl-CoA carboxylase epsilon subunit [Streptomyces sp. BR1]|uniref:acyl-CoA carboxylase epsilon subunit n=1 Tax=Streptomyces sp. BR1 TaxID=1592323 RepID=UPI00402B3D7F